jgi:tetratricopeptide (TPR) repeat protein
MKRVIAVASLLLVHWDCDLHAQALEITLPEGEWVLSAMSQPLGEREGLLRLQEGRVSDQLWPLLRQRRYEEAMQLFRNTYATTLDDMEAGIVDGPETHRSDLSAAMFYLIGNVYFSLEQPQPAETAYQSALQYLPDYVRVHEALGMLYLGQARFEDARPHLSRAAELGLNTAQLFGALGFLNQETDNHWGAVSAYQQALMLDSDNRQWQQGLLYALSRTHNYSAGLALVEQLLGTYPNDPDLWVFRAQMAGAGGDEASALASLETAIRLGHDTVANLQVCATLHMQIGSVGRAIELLQTGFAGGGMSYQFLDQALAWLIRENEWDYAEELVDSADPGLTNLNDAEASRLLTRRASIVLHNGGTSAARDQLQQALELDAANADALMELATLYQDNDNDDEAELLYQRASAYESHRENAQLGLAQLAVGQRRYQRALDLLRGVVEANPGRFDLRPNIEILENLAQIDAGL